MKKNKGKGLIEYKQHNGRKKKDIEKYFQFFR